LWLFLLQNCQSLYDVKEKPHLELRALMPIAFYIAKSLQVGAEKLLKAFTGVGKSGIAKNL
jgi:hypothetical protein